MSKEVGLLTYITRRLLWRAKSRASKDRIPYVLPGGQRMALPAGSPFASDIFCTRGRVDWGSEELLLAYLKQRNVKGCCYDVGANMGYYSVLLAPVAPSVFAFEPDPRNHADLLAQGIEGLTLIAKAVSDRCGTARFDVSSACTVGHLSSGDDSGGSIEVECTTLDTFRASRPQNEVVAAVKMDVEGFEIACLRGATHLAKSERPVFLVEFGIEEGRPNSFGGLGEFTSVHGYDIYAMIRRRSGWLGFCTTLEKIEASALASLDHKMLFLVPVEEGFFKRRCTEGFQFEKLDARD